MRKLTVILIVSVTICHSNKAYCQILNIDKVDTTAYQAKAQIDATVSSGLEIDQQKTTLYDASNYVDVALQKNKQLYILSASERFTYNGPQDVLQTGYVHLRFRQNYKQQLHLEFYSQYQWDTKLGIRHRILGGANLRYNFWYKRKWEMTFATGLMYENEEWTYDAVDTNKIPLNATNVITNLVKSNSYMKWEGSLTPTTTISFAIFYQATYDNFLAPRIASNFNIDLAISKHFSLGLKYSGIYYSSPTVPIDNFYYALSNNLVFKL